MVFGAGGQIGRHLSETGMQLGRNVAALTHAEADICDPSAVEGAIARHRPSALSTPRPKAPYIASGLKPSPGGVNLAFLGLGELIYERMGRGFAWLNTGTPDFMLDASEFVRTIEHRRGWMIACIEEIAFRSGFIDAELLLRLAASLKNTSYGRYLEHVAEEGPLQY
jgi:hypothetical protein